MKQSPYRPTKADIAFRDAVRGDRNPIEEARLLRRISLEYLIVIGSDNAASESSGLRYKIDAELARRNALPARYANWISFASFVVSLAAIGVSLAK